jgi:hypothetical protein
MKTLFVTFLLMSQNAISMGDPHFIPGNPSSGDTVETFTVDDLGDTTSNINQLTPDRTHQDQQMMEEEELNQLEQLEKQEETPTKSEDNL